MPVGDFSGLLRQLALLQQQNREGPVRAATQLGQGISQGAGAIADQLRMLQQNQRQDTFRKTALKERTDERKRSDFEATRRALLGRVDPSQIPALLAAKDASGLQGLTFLGKDGKLPPQGPRPLNPLPAVGGGESAPVPEEDRPPSPPAQTPGVDLMGTFIKAMQAGKGKTTAEAITALKPKGLAPNAIIRNARRVAGNDRLIDPILVPTEDGSGRTEISNMASEPFQRFAQRLGATITRFEQANGRPLTAQEFEEVALDTVRKRDQIEAITGISGVGHRTVPGLTVGPHGFLLNGRPLSERDLNNIRERFGGRLMMRPSLKSGGFVPAHTSEQSFPGDLEPTGQSFPGVSPRKRNEAQDRRLRTQVFVEVGKVQSLPLFSEDSVRELARLIALRRGLK